LSRGDHKRFGVKLRLATAGAVAILCLGFPTLASAQLLPSGFFDRAPMVGEGQASVEADMLSYDAKSDVVTAEGGVALSYGGYDAHGEKLVFDRRAGALHIVGNVILLAPDGTRYNADDVAITGNMKNAVLQALTVTTARGSVVTAADATFISELETILNEATYAPCGLCVDAKGRRIGWNVKAGKLVYDKRTKMVHMDDVQLALLGFPIAWLPFLTIPDPTDPNFKGLRVPSYSYAEDTGHTLLVPYEMQWGPDTSIIFTAQLMSRQGALLGAEWIQRFKNGYMSNKVSGIRQIDPSAFTAGIGDGDWRGALQSYGRFVPVKNWTVGWSYTKFSDPAYLIDYRLPLNRSSVNEIYAEYLSRDYYGEVRLQQFNLLDDVTNADQAKQARAIPNARFESVTDLGNGNGQFNLSAKLLGVQRDADHLASLNGVPYVLGLEGNKTHLMVQGAWQNQYIAPGGTGLVVSPYLGLRGDAAYYNGASAYAGSPGEVSLLSATPIAAVDVRFPMVGAAGDVAHIVEPIAQMVYRGSSTSTVGITNDDAQSFVLDDTNLFSYNRFSGTDRQETGLRANIGGRYQADFTNGGYLELMAGQSFHLAGVNGMGVIDQAQTGNSSGLQNDASYVVLGAKGSWVPGFAGGAKAQIDPATGKVMRAGLAALADFSGYKLGLDYIYLPALPATGVLKDQHEVAAAVAVPLMDYWTITGGAAWDLTANTWLEASAGFRYDDNYLIYGASGVLTGPTAATPNDLRYLFTFRLKGPDGIDVGF
jgi:LPS-assembly protein